MIVETLSTFPHIYDSFMSESMMGRARKKGLLDFHAHDLRDWTHDRHRTTDDEPYGGGPGLVMKCEPIFEATDDLFPRFESRPTTIFLSPVGKCFDESDAIELSTHERLFFICGHYEGIDERAYSLADRVYSIGDYVLTSGELASMVVIDAVVRRIPGVLGAVDGAQDESFSEGLLEHPQYTRPASYRSMDVPSVLTSGNHAAIEQWRRRQSLERTARLRPDLIDAATLSAEDLLFLQSLSK